MATRISILGISGSGRKESFNTALLEEAKRLLPDGATLDTVDVSTFPLYNQDLESSVPRAVLEFKMKIQKADAILFATPEPRASSNAPGV